MTIDYTTGNVQWATEHDPSDKKFYFLLWRPSDWLANTFYTQDVNVVSPTTPNGCIYECSSGGISGATEQTWGTVEEKKTTDGTVEWTCKPDICVLQPGDTITASTWAATGCTLTNDIIISGIYTKVRLDAIPTGAKTVTLTNHVTITRANADVEERERSIVIKVKEM